MLKNARAAALPPISEQHRGMLMSHQRHRLSNCGLQRAPPTNQTRLRVCKQASSKQASKTSQIDQRVTHVILPPFQLRRIVTHTPRPQPNSRFSVLAPAHPGPRFDRYSFLPAIQCSLAIRIGRIHLNTLITTLSKEAHRSGWASMIGRRPTSSSVSHSPSRNTPTRVQSSGPVRGSSDAVLHRSHASVAHHPAFPWAF
ncbi:hypothetical protein LY76DRAFT_289088 [Colletotrichum caudatum]|nr:hypothetical protein LY76DRAFT_289088 [Colletotrichum caudatum]